jgi:hypothetical protein
MIGRAWKLGTAGQDGMVYSLGSICYHLPVNLFVYLEDPNNEVGNDSSYHLMKTYCGPAFSHILQRHQSIYSSQLFKLWVEASQLYRLENQSLGCLGLHS